MVEDTWPMRRLRHWAFEDEARKRIAAIEQEIEDNYKKERMDDMPDTLRVRKTNGVPSPTT